MSYGFSEAIKKEIKRSCAAARYFPPLGVIPQLLTSLFDAMAHYPFFPGEPLATCL